ALRLAPHLPGAGIGRAGRRRSVRPRPGAGVGPAARRPGPPPPPGRAGGGGRRADRRRRRGPLAAASLANVLAVHLIRHVLAPGRPARGPDGALPRGRLRAVVEYIEEHLDASPTLEQIAAVAHLSPYHFARQFKTATGLPPHEYVIARRVERARQ